MIVDHFHLKRIMVMLFEANSPLVVDSYTMLPKPFSPELPKLFRKVFKKKEPQGLNK